MEVTEFCLENKNINKYFTLGSFVKKLTDPVGAGDALCSYAALGLMASYSINCIYSWFDGSRFECEFDGNIPVEPIEVLKIDYYEKFQNYNEKYFNVVWIFFRILKEFQTPSTNIGKKIYKLFGIFGLKKKT